jgi:hypothetical protein
MGDLGGGLTSQAPSRSRAVSVSCSATGTTIYVHFPDALAVAPTAPLLAATTLVVLGLAFEIGAHTLTPDYPTWRRGARAVRGVPHGGAQGRCFVAIARLVSVLPPEIAGWRPLVALLAAATMTLGNLAALGQDDVRRMLGWPSVSQSGYGLKAIVALGRTDLAVPALLYFLLAHALTNIAAFGVVTELRGRTALSDYAGLSQARPWLSTGLAVALLSLMSLPPLAGFRCQAAAVPGHCRGRLRMAGRARCRQHHRVARLLSRCGWRSRGGRRRRSRVAMPRRCGSAACGSATAHVADLSGRRDRVDAQQLQCLSGC